MGLKGRVAVIGAGTAGLIAARALADKGIRTRVYEQKAVPSSRIYASGILSMRGLEGLGIGYAPAVTNTLDGANLHAGGRVLRVRSSSPVAVVLSRERLSGICMDEALSAGASIETGRRMTTSALDSISSGSIIIGADGAVSSVANHFSMGAIDRYSLTYKAEYNVAVPDRSVVDLFFDNSVSPGLFGWLCPNAPDVLEVGIGISSSSAISAASAFGRFLKTRYVSEAVCGSRPVSAGASMIPMCMRRSIIDEARSVLLVGDAAGQVKAATGGGIVFGGNAALMAADAVYGNIASGTSLLSYRKRFMSRYGTEMKLHSLVHRLYSSQSPGTMAAMVSLSKALGAESFLGRYGDMDLPGLVIKRFFLRGLAD